jgi:GNAT superfamily N-acetyltransferase
MPEDITVRSEAADSPVAVRLIEAMVAEVEELYEFPPGSGLGLAAPPSDFVPPGGAFIVIYLAGRPVAGGGVKRDADGVAEIKRIYVAPEARGQGLGRRLLEALEETARELGYARVRLDTGDRMPHVQAMFEAAGYHRIEDYNGNPQAAFWGEKALR